MCYSKIKKIFSGVIFGLTLFLGIEVSAIEQIPYNSIEDFLSASYEILLGRDGSEDEGIEYWEYSIRNHEVALEDYMISLVEGEEFISRDISDHDYIYMLYKLIMNTEPVEMDLEYWVNRLSEETQKLGTNKEARSLVMELMLNEDFFQKLVENLGATFDFENLNNYGLKILREDYSDKNINYIERVYLSFDEIESNLESLSVKEATRSDILGTIKDTLPIFNTKEEGEEYEKLVRVYNEEVERIKYLKDYEVKLPYGDSKSVYISPFLEFDKNEGTGIDLNLTLIGKGLGKEIEEAHILLGDKKLDLIKIHEDTSKYDEQGISLYEFKFSLNNIEELRLLDESLQSSISKLRFEFSDGNTYIYNLYEKDRVRNTLRFMASMYNQMILPHLYDMQGKFNYVVLENLKGN